MVQIIRALGHTDTLIVFGSSSLLSIYPEEGEPEGVIAASYDADFVPEPWNEDVAFMLNEAIGRDRRFEKIHGYHADFVRPSVYDSFPTGWRDRLVALPGFEAVWCLEPHDMAAAKCQAGRPKDIEQLAGLTAKSKIDLDLVAERLRSMTLVEKVIAKSHGTLNSVRARADELRKLKAATDKPTSDAPASSL